jgi:hypothetical protein
MKLNNFSIIIILLFLSCQPITEVNLRNTILIDGVYCHKNGNVLNGHIRIITNDSTINSHQNWDEVNFVDGIPTGKYKRYEFDDLTSIGEFTTIEMPSNSPIRRITMETDSLLYHNTTISAYIIIKNNMTISDTLLYYELFEKEAEKLYFYHEIMFASISTGEYDIPIKYKQY